MQVIFKRMQFLLLLENTQLNFWKLLTFNNAPFYFEILLFKLNFLEMFYTAFVSEKWFCIGLFDNVKLVQPWQAKPYTIPIPSLAHSLQGLDVVLTHAHGLAHDHNLFPVNATAQALCLKSYLCFLTPGFKSIKSENCIPMYYFLTSVLLWTPSS